MLRRRQDTPYPRTKDERWLISSTEYFHFSITKDGIFSTFFEFHVVHSPEQNYFREGFKIKRNDALSSVSRKFSFPASDTKEV